MNGRCCVLNADMQKWNLNSTYAICGGVSHACLCSALYFDFRLGVFTWDQPFTNVRLIPGHVFLYLWLILICRTIVGHDDKDDNDVVATVAVVIITKISIEFREIVYFQRLIERAKPWSNYYVVVKLIINKFVGYFLLPKRCQMKCFVWCVFYVFLWYKTRNTIYFVDCIACVVGCVWTCIYCFLFFFLVFYCLLHHLCVEWAKVKFSRCHFIYRRRSTQILWSMNEFLVNQIFSIVAVFASNASHAPQNISVNFVVENDRNWYFYFYRKMFIFFCNLEYLASTNCMGRL